MDWKKVNLKVPFNTPYSKKVHKLATQKVGTITPIYFSECVPGSDTSIDLSMSLSFPPLASDCFPNIDYRVEAFFVPMRLLFSNYDEYFANANVHFAQTGGGVSNLATALAPVVRFTSPVGTSSAEQLFLGQMHGKLGTGSLADYLGFRQRISWFGDNTHTNNAPEMSLLPFLAYWRCIDDWYKNRKIQTPVFAKISAAVSNASRLRSSPWVPYYQVNYLFTEPTNQSDWDNMFGLCDGHCIFDLCQRNWDYDMYSTALPTIPDEVVATDAYDIASPHQDFRLMLSKFYAGNALYQFKQRNNLVSERYVDQLAARYGAHLSDSIAQRCILLGSASFNVLTSGVMQNSQDTTASVSTNNPFQSVGARYGSAFVNGNNFRVNFRAEEAGFVFVMGTIVPKASYAFGTNPLLRKYRHAGSIVDMPDHILEQTGMEKVAVQDIAECAIYSDTLQQVGQDLFGYQDRFYSAKDEVNTVHGLFRAGESLDSFVTQRALVASSTSPVSISTNFLEIPTTACDNITAVTSELSRYGGIGDFFFRVRQKLPLRSNPLPTLVNVAEEHGKTVSINRQGKQVR